MCRVLHFRREHEPLFTQGTYLPLEAAGPKRDHVCAFARTLEDEAILIVVPRLVVRLAGGSEQPPMGPDVWGTTRLLLPASLAGRRYRNLLTGEVLVAEGPDGTSGLALAVALADFPVALLECCG